MHSGLALLYQILYAFLLDDHRASKESVPQVIAMSHETPIARSTRADWFVLLLLAISLSGNVLLGTAFFRLTSRMTSPTDSPQRNATSGPEVGTVLPPLEAERLGGTRETLAFSEGERPTLLYVFTPSCQWCERNYDNLRTMLATAKDSHRVVVLSLDPQINAADYVDLGVPVYRQPSDQTAKAYQLGPTPQTIVLSSRGKVIRTWTGAYSSGIETDVESYFSISLPGLIRSTRTADQSRPATGQGGTR